MSRGFFSRRQFVKGLAVGGTMLGIGISPTALLASTSSTTQSPVLRGNKFDLSIAPMRVNFTGTERTATGINGSIPGPILRWKEGETVTLNMYQTSKPLPEESLEVLFNRVTTDFNRPGINSLRLGRLGCV